MTCCDHRPRSWLLITSVGVASVMGCRRPPAADHLAPPGSTAAIVAAASASASATPRAEASRCPARRWLTAYDIAPDGQRLVTSCDGDDCDEDPADTAIDVWDLAAGRVARTLEAPSASIRPSWAGNGLLVAQSRSGTGVQDLTLWETHAFQTIHSGPHYCAYPSFDGPSRRMLITGCDGFLETFDVRSRQLRARPEAEAHRGGDYSVSGWFSHDGRRVYVQDEAFGLQALDAGTLRRRATVPSTGTQARIGDAPTSVAAWAPESDRFALLDGSGALRLLRSDLSISATVLPASASAPARRLMWLDERRLATFAEDGTITILDLASPAAKTTLPPAPPAGSKCTASLTVSPKRTWIAFRRTDCGIDLLDAALNKQWSIPTLPPATRLDQPPDMPPALAFSPDDRHLAAIFDERSLAIYDAAFGAQWVDLKLPPGLGQTSKSGGSYRPIVPGWSPDGRFAVVAQGEVFLVRPRDGAFVVLSMFEEAGKRLAVVSSDAAFDGAAALEPCAFPAGSTPRAPRRATPGLLASFFAAR